MGTTLATSFHIVETVLGTRLPINGEHQFFFLNISDKNFRLDEDMRVWSAQRLRRPEISGGADEANTTRPI
ncbi:TPA: hypothetical protein ACK3RG_006910 [Burkholderia cepacia]